MEYLLKNNNPINLNNEILSNNFTKNTNEQSETIAIIEYF